MKKLNLKTKLQKLNRLIMPPAEIGGLQISNTSIRFMALKRGAGKAGHSGELSSKSASLRLPPGIIEEGRVKDRLNFILALKSLHAQITPKNKEIINAILTIPAGDVYVETFNLPVLADKSVDEAAELNMQMISPNPIEKSYYSWMVVSDPATEGNQIEALGAFALKEVVDELTYALEEAGFAVAAVEFSSLSLKRLLINLGAVTSASSYLLIKLTQEGLIFMIIKNSNLYFNYFHSWGKIEELGVDSNGAITLEKALGVVGSESQRVLNFYSSHYGGQIKNIILISSVFTDEITSFLKSRYPSSDVVVLRSDKDNLHGVRGAALRGLVERNDDPEIDLLGQSTVNAFWRDRIARSVNLWRNISLTASLFILILFGASWYFVLDQENKVRALAASTPEQTNMPELLAFENEAKRFNSIVSVLLGIRNSELPIVQIINDITAAAGNNISITRLSLKSKDSSGFINGTTSREDLIFDFRDRLELIPGIPENGVDLQLPNITRQPNGSWAFSINFKLTK